MKRIVRRRRLMPSPETAYSRCLRARLASRASAGCPSARLKNHLPGNATPVTVWVFEGATWPGSGPIWKITRLWMFIPNSDQCTFVCIHWQIGKERSHLLSVIYSLRMGPEFFLTTTKSEQNRAFCRNVSVDYSGGPATEYRWTDQKMQEPFNSLRFCPTETPQ